MLLLSYRGAGTHRTVDEIPDQRNVGRWTERRKEGIQEDCRRTSAVDVEQNRLVKSRDIDMGIVGAMNPVEPCEESAPDANVTRKPGLLMLPEGEPNTMKPDRSRTTRR